MVSGSQSPANVSTVDWLDELQLLAAEPNALCAAARLAVSATVGSFAAEDGFLSPAAADASAQLAVAPELRARRGRAGRPGSGRFGLWELSRAHRVA